MPAASRYAPVGSDRGDSFGPLLLASLFHALEHARGGGANRPLARCLREIDLALQHESVPAAIRLIDRAWRSLPDAVEVLAPIYGRLLLLEDREHDAALRLLEQIEVRDADVAALTIRAYLRLLRTDDARRYLS